jgi:hypothetical protein
VSSGTVLKLSAALGRKQISVVTVQTCLGPASSDISRGKRLLTRTAIGRCKTLLADCVRASSTQLFYLFAICDLQQAKDPNVTGLELIESVRQYVARDNYILEAMFQDLERFIRSEAITDKYSGFPARSSLSLGIKHKLELVETNLRVGTVLYCYFAVLTYNSTNHAKLTLQGD